MMKAFQERFDVQVLHAWGMTEMSPVGTVATLKRKQQGETPQARAAIQAKQGRTVYGVDMKIVDPEGKELPWDGVASGQLMVRGPWVI
jgi:fatty-acyl-CoA synthase